VWSQTKFWHFRSINIWDACSFTSYTISLCLTLFHMFRHSFHQRPLWQKPLIEPGLVIQLISTHLLSRIQYSINQNHPFCSSLCGSRFNYYSFGVADVSVPQFIWCSEAVRRHTVDLITIRPKPKTLLDGGINIVWSQLPASAESRVP
jgi:hypothetical protein